MITKKKLATQAIHIEQNIIKENVGSQDQIWASYGGLHRINFFKDNDFDVEPLTIKQVQREGIKNNLMLYFTGMSRIAEEIAAKQISNLKSLERDPGVNIACPCVL